MIVFSLHAASIYLNRAHGFLTPLKRLHFKKQCENATRLKMHTDWISEYKSRDQTQYFSLNATLHSLKHQRGQPWLWSRSRCCCRCRRVLCSPTSDALKLWGAWTLEFDFAVAISSNPHFSVASKEGDLTSLHWSISSSPRTHRTQMIHDQWSCCCCCCWPT